MAAFATDAFLFAAALPLLSWLVSLWTGLLVDSRRTRAITEAVVVFILGVTGGLILGAKTDLVSCAVAANIALTLGLALEAVWLAWRWRRLRPRPGHG